MNHFAVWPAINVTQKMTDDHINDERKRENRMEEGRGRERY